MARRKCESAFICRCRGGNLQQFVGMQQGRRACAGWKLALPALVALVGACGSSEEPKCRSSDAARETICVARRGGQTGMEGSCLPVPVPRPFSAERVRALIEGAHGTTLAYRPAGSRLGDSMNASNGVPLTVVVELQGEPQIIEAVGDNCNLRIVQDVQVTLRLDDPALDVVIETTAHAFSSHFVMVQEELDGTVASALGLPPKKVTLSMAFDVNGLGGTIEANDDCGAAVFPAGARCPEWTSLEVDLGSERNGFDPHDALPRLYDLADVPLRWLNAPATTLSVELSDVPGFACSNAWIETFGPETLEAPVSIRVTTADGSIAAELPAELRVSLSTEHSAASGQTGPAGEVQGAALFVNDAIVPESALGERIWPSGAGEAVLGLRVFLDGAGAQAEAEVRALELRSIGLTAPLDSTLDPARASCIASPGRGQPQTR